MFWTCNYCKIENESEWGALEREGPSCMKCGSSVRQRQLRRVIDAVVLELPKYWIRKPRALGLSDAPIVQDYLQSKRSIRYKNTFFDQPPRLDITSPAKRYLGKLDLLISSDVLEHVFYPVSRALSGHRALLKNGGTLVLTVPYTIGEANQEHYPWMVSYLPLQLESGRWVVIGKDVEGNIHQISNPIFHGGPGNTLEMRLLSLEYLIEVLSNQGFDDITLHSEDVPADGIRIQLAVITAKASNNALRQNHSLV